MAHRKHAATTATLSAMLNDVSDDDLARSDQDMMPTPDSQTENKAPGRKTGASAAHNRGKPPVGIAGPGVRVQKSKSVAARSAGNRATAVTGVKSKKGAASKAKGRKALEELDNVNEDGDMTEDFGNLDNQHWERKESKGSAHNSRVNRIDAVSGNFKLSRKTVPETQVEAMQIDDSVLADLEPTIRGTSTVRQTTSAYTALAPIVSSRPGRTGSRPPEPLLSMRRRAGSASSTERGNDPTLRRKLGDMTKKFESLDVKYRQLKEAASSEAMSNFEKLRQSTEQTVRDQNAVIASLKKELAAQKAHMKGTEDFREQMNALEAERSRLRAEKDELSTSLQMARNESKSLSMKLAALRSSTQPEVKISGSALNSASHRINANATSTRTGDAQTMQLKEDLYSDLTGLLVRSVKRGEVEDTYDCIVTGRNGTLHFLLTVDHNPPAPTTPGTTASYEDTNFFYEPLLDERNDRDLISILPDYLCEEGIEFPRSQAALFFKKIVDCLNQRVQLVDDVGEESE